MLELWLSPSDAFLRRQILTPRRCRCAAKTDRLKQAKADADKEVAAYKAEREAAYKEKMASVCGGRDPGPCASHDPPHHRTQRRGAVLLLARCDLHLRAKQCMSPQNTSSAGDTVKRLGAESDDQVQQIQKNVEAHKKAVSKPTPAFGARHRHYNLVHCPLCLRLIGMFMVQVVETLISYVTTVKL